MPKGTYVALRVLSPSSNQLYEYCQANGILVNKPTFERRLHVTVIYSRKPAQPAIIADPTNHVAEFKNFDLFSPSSTATDNCVLVLKLTAPSIVARHLKLMAEHDTVFDFPVFQPHVTLSTAWYGKLEKLPPIEFPIYCGQEYVEELEE